jgi:predicted phosphate transport protein (TIGR00153 family)
VYIELALARKRDERHTMRLVPRDEKYFGMLTELAGKVRKGGELFVKVFEDYENHSRYADQIKQIELECDSLAAKITQRLNSSFITPIDREDIYLLVTELDDVIDLTNDLARRFEIYNVAHPRPEAAEVAALLGQATSEIYGAFQKLEHNQNCGEHCRTIAQLEKRADSIYRDALRRLFAEEKDPIEVVKWKSIFEELENSIDRCKDVSEALEAVVVKNK